MNRFLILAALASLLILAGCGESGTTTTQTTVTTSTTSLSSTTTTTLKKISEYKNDIEVMVFTDKSTYSLSAEVTFTVKTKNITAVAINTFYPTAQTYDLIVKKSGVYAWQRYYNKAFLGIPISFTLGPGSTETIVNYKWDQKDNNGNYVPPGSYSITGYLGDPLNDMSSTEYFSIL